MKKLLLLLSIIMLTATFVVSCSKSNETWVREGQMHVVNRCHVCGWMVEVWDIESHLFDNGTRKQVISGYLCHSRPFCNSMSYATNWYRLQTNSPAIKQ